MVDYSDEKGRRVFVAREIYGTGWRSFRFTKTRKWSAVGMRKKEMPIVQDFDEAQKNLDDYAKKQGWRIR